MDKNSATEAEIAKAREIYASEDIAIDDNARASRAIAPGAGGVWIEAWLWVETKTIEGA